MFIVLVHYKKSLSIVDHFIPVHRAYLDEGYKNHYLIASGPRVPRDGGILLSQLSDRTVLEKFLYADPFYINDIADYEIIEFEAVKYHPDFSPFIHSI